MTFSCVSIMTKAATDMIIVRILLLYFAVWICFFHACATFRKNSFHQENLCDSTEYHIHDDNETDKSEWLRGQRYKYKLIMDFEQSTHSQIFQYGLSVSFYSLEKNTVLFPVQHSLFYALVDNIQFAHRFDIYNMYNTDIINQLSFQLRLIIPQLFIVHHNKTKNIGGSVRIRTYIHFRRTGIRKSKEALFEKKIHSSIFHYSRLGIQNLIA